MEQNFQAMGHNTSALARVAAGLTPAGKLLDQRTGIDFYQFLCDLLVHFDERAESLIEKLEVVAKRVFTDDVVLSFTGTQEDLVRMWEAGGTFDLEEGFAGCERELVVPEPVPQNEAFIVPSDVCYVGAGTNRAAIKAVPFDGTTNIVTRVLSYDYLWNEVRVKGGAYGAGFKATRTGTVMFYSFRDPNLDHTVEVYNGSGRMACRFRSQRSGTARLYHQRGCGLRRSAQTARSCAASGQPLFCQPTCGLSCASCVPRCSRRRSKIFVRAAQRSNA